MTYKAMKMKVWTRGADVRVYIDTRFVDHRDPVSCAGDVYLYAKDDGSIGWRHAFRTGPHAIRRAEMAAMGAGHLYSDGWLPATFAELLERIAASQTPGGNFSMPRYERQFLSAA
jgi:hypothetical protein